MRKEPYGVGSFVHVMQRGVRGVPIVRNDDDRWRFLKLLRYLNDANVPRNWERDIAPENIRAGFSRPAHWPAQKPYASIIAFCLQDNHFHLLLKETQEGGISKFMQRLSTSMAAYLNAKYDERGTPFQGSFRSRTVGDDVYLQYLNAYILVKNTFEIYPHGAQQAARSFDAAFAWAEAYPFSSLIDYMGHRHGEFLDYDEIARLFENNDSFKSFARDVIYGRMEGETDFLERMLT
jgi:hypothetical protein